MISIRLPNEIEARLDYLAVKTGRTKTFYMREALLEYLDNIEEQFLAEKTVEDLKAGKEHLINFETLALKYDLED